MRTGKAQPIGNRTLSQAKKAKQDEFYTQLNDISNELKHYKTQLRGKVILCNCDDPYESCSCPFARRGFESVTVARCELG